MAKKTDAELAREWADEAEGNADPHWVDDARVALLRRLAAQSEALVELLEAAEDVPVDGHNPFCECSGAERLFPGIPEKMKTCSLCLAIKQAWKAFKYTNSAALEALDGE